MPAELTEALARVAEQAWTGRVGDDRWFCRWCNVYKPGPHDAGCPMSRLAAEVEDAERMEYLSQQFAQGSHWVSIWGHGTAFAVRAIDDGQLRQFRGQTLRAAIEAARTTAPGERS
jgi:hypothetical protein